MSQTQLRPEPLAKVAGLGFVKATMPDNSKYNAPSSIRQDTIDVVGFLSARSRVAPATIRAHLAAFGMEARS